MQSSLRNMHLQSVYGFRMVACSFIGIAFLFILVATSIAKYLHPWLIPMLSPILFLICSWGLWLVWENSTKRYIEQDITIPKEREKILRSYGVNRCSVKGCTEPLVELNVMKLDNLVGRLKGPNPDAGNEEYRLAIPIVLGYCEKHEPYSAEGMPLMRFFTASEKAAHAHALVPAAGVGGASTPTRSNLQEDARRTVPRKVNVVLGHGMSPGTPVRNRPNSAAAAAAAEGTADSSCR